MLVHVVMRANCNNESTTPVPAEAAHARGVVPSAAPSPSPAVAAADSAATGPSGRPTPSGLAARRPAPLLAAPPLLEAPPEEDGGEDGGDEGDGAGGGEHDVEPEVAVGALGDAADLLGAPEMRGKGKGRG